MTVKSKAWHAVPQALPKQHLREVFPGRTAWPLVLSFICLSRSLSVFPPESKFRTSTVCLLYTSLRSQTPHSVWHTYCSANT